MFSLIYAWTNGQVNNQDVGDLIRQRAYYDVTVMFAYPCVDKITLRDKYNLLAQQSTPHQITKCNRSSWIFAAHCRKSLHESTVCFEE